MRGAPRATGIYSTRAELVEEVMRLWRETPLNQTDISKSVRVSLGTVAHIIDNKYKERT